MVSELFANRLKMLMEEKSMTQKCLATRARITEAALSRYLNDGRMPRLDVVANLATVLDTTTDYLLGRTEHPGEALDFRGIKRLVARGTIGLSSEDKIELVNIILGKDK